MKSLVEKLETKHAVRISLQLEGRDTTRLLLLSFSFATVGLSLVGGFIQNLFAVLYHREGNVNAWCG